MAQKLADILKQKFLKKGDNGKNPKIQDKNVVNNSGNNTEIITHTLSKDGLKIEDKAPPSTAAKTSKINIKKVCEGIINKLQARNHLLNLTGNDEQRSNAKRALHEAHGMMSRFAREYEERRLKFVPPNNVTNPNNNVNDDDDDEDNYDDRFKQFNDKVDNMTSTDEYQNQNGESPENCEDGSCDNQDDVEMEFGATGADDMKDISSDLTIGDIINNVINAIKSNPEISVVDAFKQALEQEQLSDDDVDFYDEKDPVDDDVDYDADQSDYQPDLEKDGETSNTDDTDYDQDPQGEPGQTGIKNNPLNQNPTQTAQRTDGSLMGFRRLG